MELREEIKNILANAQTITGKNIDTIVDDLVKKVQAADRTDLGNAAATTKVSDLESQILELKTKLGSVEQTVITLNNNWQQLQKALVQTAVSASNSVLPSNSSTATDPKLDVWSTKDLNQKFDFDLDNAQETVTSVRIKQNGKTIQKDGSTYRLTVSGNKQRRITPGDLFKVLQRV